MDEFRLLLDLVLAVLAAFAGGVLAQRVGLPVVVGYLTAGVVLGPFTPGFTVDQRSIGIMADIGVAFLMFAVGSEFSRVELRRLGRVALVGGLVQILATMAIGPLLAPLLGASPVQGVFLGALIALSSTVVALKVLMARGELESVHGRVTLGILVIQDLAVIPMVVVLPAVAGSGAGSWQHLLLTAGEAVALVVGTYVVGARAVPWVLGRVAVHRTRELFLLGVVGLALGTALIAQAIGLSLAFGAFLAGLVIAESEYRTQVVAEVLPLRDIFIALFFVSVGMLIDPRLLIDRVFLVGVLTGVVVVGKMLIGSVAVLLAGMPARVALLAGLSLAQVGEFSFVLARVGVDRGAIPSLFLELILATSLTTVILAPFTIRSAPILIGGLRRLPLVGRRLLEPGVGEADSGGLKRHAVICGYGRVGRELVDALTRRRIPCLVIEYNPDTVRQLRARGVPVIYGDASNPGVLHHAGLPEARILAVLTGDPIDTEQIVRQARVANPRLDIVARARDAEQVGRLQRLGVTEVVQPEFEAGVEVIRHALQRYGVSGTELNVVATGRRRAFYERGLGEGS